MVKPNEGTNTATAQHRRHPSSADHSAVPSTSSADSSSAKLPPSVAASPRVNIVIRNHSPPPSQPNSAQQSPSASSSASCSVPPPSLPLHHHHPLPPGAIVAARSSAGGAAAASSPSQSSPMRSLSSASGGLYVSAPGKIILFGEHAVVYGRTAIAGSIDLRTYLSLFTSADGRIYLSLPDMNIEKTWMLKDLQREIAKIPVDLALLSEDPPSLELIVPIARKLSGACEEQCGVQNLAILAFWYLLIGVLLRKRAVDLEMEQQQRGETPTNEEQRAEWIISSPPASPSACTGIGSCPLQDAKSKSVPWDLLAVKVTVRFKLPSCVGLGSSGAYCVCIAAALLQTAGLIPPPNVSVDTDELTWDESLLDGKIRKWASAAESLIHGRASGLDAAICTYGGLASYTPGKRIENLHNAPDLLKVILINSKVERNTSRLVQAVKENYRKYPSVVEPIFDTIDALAYEAAKILQKQPVLLSAAGGENGSMVLENGGRSGRLTPHAVTDGPGASGSGGEPQLNNLQPVPSSLGGRSSSIGGTSTSYFAAGKRGSNASAVSGLSTGTSRIERSELTETFDRLNELCRMNNQLLITLGVGHAKVDHICTMLGRYGIHPKMTGAGGGGCLFAFLKPDISQTILNMIREELRKEGYEMWQPTLGGPGVLQHQHKPEIFTSTTGCSTTSSSTSSTGRGSGSSVMAAIGPPISSGVSPFTRSNTPASSHQTTPAIRHKK